jgi:hypothetical protein
MLPELDAHIRLVIVFHRTQVFFISQVRFCLRNMPEVRWLMNVENFVERTENLEVDTFIDFEQILKH